MNLNIDYLCCGIWNYEVVSSLEHYLTQNSAPVFIWNIWVCDYWNSESEEKSEPIQVSSIINIHTEKEVIIPPFLQIASLKNCFSGENIILENFRFQNGIWIWYNEIYFDMESWWVEFVASKYKYPRLILRLPFYYIWMKTESSKIEKSLNDLEFSLKNLPYHEYLWKILDWINKTA